MPKLTTSLPRYRKHKASGQAVVTIAGKDHYLGRHGSKSSRMLYDRLIVEWLSNDSQAAKTAGESLTITEIIARYWKHAQQFYRKPDGTPQTRLTTSRRLSAYLDDFTGTSRPTSSVPCH